MAQYYKTRPCAKPSATSTRTHAGDVRSDFDRMREALLATDAEEGWAPELRRYLGTMQRDVTKDTDLVQWWQVGLGFYVVASITNDYSV
jgi:hypothetical protein